jgi:sulfatase maturation enzyme AslB (radical SAM superfamily)
MHPGGLFLALSIWRSDMFLLFVGWDYYPEGGWNDYWGTYNTLEEAEAAYSNIKRKTDWCHIVDISGEIPRLVKEKNDVRCDICGKRSVIFDSWFNYFPCEDHEHLTPNQYKDEKEKLKGKREL